MKELWQVQSKISNIRRNIRALLSGKSGESMTEKNIINKLSRLGVVKEGVVLDDLLDLNERQFLERRLESVVFRKGLAKSMKQARQLIVHGFISINNKKVDKPGYIVDVKDELNIAYHKKIDINQNNNQGKKNEENAENEKSADTNTINDKQE